MHAFRLALAAGAAAVAVSAATSTAAPPEGCYGLPDYPPAFLCVTSFTPENAVPGTNPGGGSTVTSPRFCAGECYGPIPIPLPGLASGGGSVAVVTYNGQTYVVAVGGGLPPVPPLPPLPPLPQSGSCPGSDRLDPAVATAEPYVCARSGHGTYGTTAYYVGTCVTPTCTVLQVPTGLAEDLIRRFVDGVRTFVQEFDDLDDLCIIATDPNIC